MKIKLFVILSLILTTTIILTACGAAAATQAPAAPDVFVQENPAAPADGFGYGGAPAVGQEAEKSALPAPTAGADYQTVPDIGNVPGPAESIDRKIVKNAELSVLVKDSDIAIDRLTQVVSDVGGYIVSSRVWYQTHVDGENYKYASVTLGVPVDQFETTMRRVRALGLRVLDENASGEDVTDQFVDLQSRLTNLEATQARIQSFLEDAKTVDEALRINQELAQIEAQIEEVKGKMKYLSDRSAFSTITVSISPDLPVIEPAPAPTPEPWTPGKTLKDATQALVNAYQGFVEFAIWLFVAVLPILVPPALVLWLIFKLVRRKPGKQPANSQS
jgi:Domain of unknown function (DUF4349)